MLRGGLEREFARLESGAFGFLLLLLLLLLMLMVERALISNPPNLGGRPRGEKGREGGHQEARGGVREGCRRRNKVAIFPQFLTSHVHFVRKGCAQRLCTLQSRNFPQFLTSNVHVVRKGCRRRIRIAILPRFWTSDVHFVRKGCVSWRSGGTAPGLKREIERRAREDPQM